MQTGTTRLVAVLISLVLLIPVGAWAAKAKAPTTLTVDLPGAYTDVFDVVKQVAANGTVSGSAEYEKDRTIAGAQSGNATQLFAPYSGPGKVVYKLRAGTLAPSHFQESNDVGTVAVRYIVQELTPATTRVTIDAVFVEDGRHRLHPSDGAVEAGELGELQKELRIQEQHKLEARRQHDAEELAKTEATAALEKKELERAVADASEMEQRVESLRHTIIARVKSSTEMKAAPYSRASVVGEMAQGETVDVLSSTAHWCHVRNQRGQQGWIAYSLVEALP